VPRVVRDDDQAESQRLRGDERVECPDALPLAASSCFFLAAYAG
jgi:hypothetical protein